MDFFNNVLLFFSGIYFIVIILPFIIMFAYFIGAFVITKLTESERKEERKIEESSKFKKYIKFFFHYLITTLVGLFIMYSALEILSQCGGSSENEEIMIRKD